MTNKNSRKLLKLAVTLSAIFIIAAYALYEARDLLYGVPVKVEMPQNGETFESQIITVAGRAGHIENLKLNGKTVLTDPEGRFSETIVLGEGINILHIEVTDRFSRTQTQVLNVVYEPTHTLTANQLPTNKR